MLRLSLRKSDLKSARSRLNFTQAQTALPETYDSVIQYVGSRKILPSHKRYTSRQITAPSFKWLSLISICQKNVKHKYTI